MLSHATPFKSFYLQQASIWQKDSSLCISFKPDILSLQMTFEPQSFSQRARALPLRERVPSRLLAHRLLSIVPNRCFSNDVGSVTWSALLAGGESSNPSGCATLNTQPPMSLAIDSCFLDIFKNSFSESPRRSMPFPSLSLLFCLDVRTSSQHSQV